MRLSIVVPAHNEEDNIADVINKIESCVDLPYELVFVNDHSTDATAKIVNSLAGQYNNIRLVENKNDKGFVNAIRAGFDNIRTEAVVLVMADLCDDLPTIRVMFEKLNDGFDVVCGSRYIKGGRRRGGSKIKGFFSALVGKSIKILVGVPTSDISNAFKMYRKKVLDSVDIKSKGFEVSMEIPLKAYYLGFKIGEVPTVWKERAKGKSNFKMFEVMPGYFKLYIWATIKKIFG